MNVKPAVFIASSLEAASYAQAVNIKLEEDAHSDIWENAFNLSSITILSLIEKTKKVDYAVFIFHPDDRVFIRDAEFDSVRDNVVLELGLFIGKLGLDKCFILIPRSKGNNFRLPSDLLGVTVTTYDDQDTDIVRAVTTSCSKIKLRIKELENSRKETEAISEESNLREELIDAKAQIMGAKFEVQNMEGKYRNVVETVKTLFFSVAKPATPLEIKEWEDGAKASQLKEVKIERHNVYVIDKDVMIPPLFGVDSISLIVLKGVKIYGVEHCGHSNIHYMDGFRVYGVLF